jgi:hypothetical protein
MHSCITPYRNFKDSADLKGKNQAHESAMTNVSAIVFNTAMRVLNKTPCLKTIVDKFDRLYLVRCIDNYF